VTASGPFVYCIVSSSKPITPAATPGLPGAGPVRALDIRPGRYLIVSDVPLAQFQEATLAAKLSDLDWVSRAAMAHERVNESFMATSPPADAVVPMKLFTLFTSDERALEEVRKGWKRVEGVIKRLSRNEEWGVRLVYDAAAAAKVSASAAPAASGRGYLLAKRQQQAASVKQTTEMRRTASDVIKALRPIAHEVQKRSVTEPPESRNRLLLDAAFLVPRAKADRFRKSVEVRAKKIAPAGYALQLSGPWPPYSFV
jgi:hypothetical protein